MLSCRLARHAVALAVALLLAPATADAATITFEDLTTAPPPGGHGLNVNTQYAGQGVTFNDVEAYKFPAGQAHSGVIAVETCVAVEFCTSPIQATFTAAQQRVRVWVGYDATLMSPLPVRLTAFNNQNGVVGTANATLPVRSGPTPASTPLTVELGSPQISKVQVTVPGGFTNGVVADDVEFTVPGPPPPCNATRPPDVQVGRPSDTRVQTNSFVLQGEVSNGGASNSSATITIDPEGPGATRTASLYPGTIHADGGAFGPITFPDYLSPGVNVVTISVANCRGSGASKRATVRFEPVSADASLRLIAPIEVTQGVQDATNSIPLVGLTRAGDKRTFARVALDLEGTTTSIRDLSATLVASRPDGSLPVALEGIRSINRIQVNGDATLADVRKRLEGALIFELPGDWTRQGKLHVQLDKFFVEGKPAAIGCPTCVNTGSNGAPALVSFLRSPPLRILLVSVGFRIDAMTEVRPAQRDMDMAASWLRRAYPSADIEIGQRVLDTLPVASANCNLVNNALRAWAAPFWAPPLRIYGMYPEVFTNIIGGCADIGGFFGSGPTGVPRVPDPAVPDDEGFHSWDTDGSYGDWYSGHEIGHMYRRLHPGFCGGQTDGDAERYPYPNGEVGDAARDNVGFDPGDASFGVASRLYTWNASAPAHDVMTYCNDQWLSGYTYRGIMRCLRALELPLCLPGSLPFGRVSATRRVRDRLVVNGSLTPSSGKVELQPLSVLPEPGLSLRPRKSRYAIRLRGRRDKRIARYPFAPKRVSDQTKRIDTIQEVVPFDRRTRRIEITRGKRVLERVRVSTHAPRVTVRSPSSLPATLEWRARDKDRGSKLRYTVLYAADGRTFETVAAGLRTRELDIDPSSLGGGEAARLKVIATDGVLTGQAVSDPLAVEVKAPRVRVATPFGTVEAGVPQPFVGIVEDLQEPQVPDDRITWASSIQGEIGRGDAITAALESRSGDIAAIEVKSGASLAAQTLPLGDRLWAVPVSGLWT